MKIFWQILCGIAGGFLGGMGFGGGTLLIPLLTILLSFNQKLSQGINLLSFLVMAIFSLAIHYKNGLVSTKNLTYIILGGLPLTIIGAYLATILPSQVLRKFFGGFLILLAGWGIAKSFKKEEKFSLKKVDKKS